MKIYEVTIQVKLEINAHNETDAEGKGRFVLSEMPVWSGGIKTVGGDVVSVKEKGVGK